ncbi:D-isomer specific 2-hydroxyacid dehydrogenase family protein [Ihubacter sp. rT4E-8]|uniref:D-isomer specific 2-hydroxyacid dehydrogenase family protein n=1 Tax=Ihubacter sp. rT4E-8 TaxID=3242369 RepID=UPI0013794589
MRLFVYSMRDFDEKPFFDTFCKKYGVEYGYTAETPCLENTDLAAGYDAVDIITTVISREMIDRFYALGVKCISTRTIGYDHIDWKYAKSLGMGVTNVTYSPASVADYTIMMILMGLRKMKHIMMRGDVQDFTLRGKLARELPSCTVGVVGTGRIGETVIRNLSGFGCRILAYDMYQKDSLKGLCEYVERERLFEESDIITLHAPATEESYHMIDGAALKRMKPGVGIVNCARGALIDSDALIEAIESQKVGFACLDVVEHESGLYYFDRMGEPLGNPRLAILRSYANVIVTSHMAFYTDEAVANMAENSILGAKKYIEGAENPFAVV